MHTLLKTPQRMRMKTNDRYIQLTHRNWMMNSNEHGEEKTYIMWRTGNITLIFQEYKTREKTDMHRCTILQGANACGLGNTYNGNSYRCCTCPHCSHTDGETTTINTRNGDHLWWREMAFWLKCPSFSTSLFYFTSLISSSWYPALGRAQVLQDILFQFLHIHSFTGRTSISDFLISYHHSAKHSIAYPASKRAS